ncbi:NAD(P)-binding protein [Ganoderma leucocontextum]|nr:NAD(P)-binding protein [Ganoderma leucocontextum]
MFEVNFWGAVHISQEAVRFFRDENKPQGGRLIQNSAGVGLVTIPTMGFYASAKHGGYKSLYILVGLVMGVCTHAPVWGPRGVALEGFTETLNKELSPAPQISSVLFGGFVTEFSTSSLQVLPQHPAYADDANAAAAFRKLFGGATVESQKKHGFGDPKKGVQKVYELSTLPNPPLRLLLGKDINQYVRQYIAQLTKEVDEYAAWSDNSSRMGPMCRSQGYGQAGRKGPPA